MCIGPFKRLCHWGPLIALGIVKCIALSTLHCTSMWWPPTGSVGGLVNTLLFSMWNGFVLYNFFNSMFTGPGHVPLNWRPEDSDDEQYLQYCNQCKAFKAPRAHHCRRCNRCIMKMDHHCPWINNCCGHKNHASFTLFLLFAVCGCIHASVILSCSLYRAIYMKWHIYHEVDPIIYLGLNGFLIAIFALGLAIGVILAVGLLFIIQMKCILKNETGIESWIVSKASRPHKDGTEFVYPYNLGIVENLKQVFCWSEQYDDDGIFWPVKDGCNQYTLTIEQIQQKNEKKRHMREYTVTEEFSGSRFPISKGIRVAFTSPCSDDPKIAVNVGDKVLVSRWKKHWLYGEVQMPNHHDASRIRGWFPRCCAIEIINGNVESHLRVHGIVTKKKV